MSPGCAGGAVCEREGPPYGKISSPETLIDLRKGDKAMVVLIKKHYPTSGKEGVFDRIPSHVLTGACVAVPGLLFSPLVTLIEPPSKFQRTHSWVL